MIRRLKWCWLVLALAVPLFAPSTGGAAIAPPWCGTPVPDAAAALPDGTSPTHPLGSFPHIPYYAIGCTLQSIAAQSNGRMKVEVIAQSALGRDMYLVTINELRTRDQRRDFASWRVLRALSLSRPARAQQLLRRLGDNVKVPLYIQGGIHGNEFEGVDANMLSIERLATTPYGADPEVDRILDHSVVLFNVIQNPDGRIAGLRQNGNGFDLNRDFLTQSQPETKASVGVMQEWQPPDMLDLHGYLTPVLLIEATTKPHNPGIEYDLWLKWNQTRIDANEAALNARGFGVQRPINDWCADAGEAYPYVNNLCPTNDATTSDDGLAPGPAAAEGWDDWGPFYTPMYSQLVGMNGSTVEMCRLEDDQCEGRLGARIQQENITWSTLLFNVQKRHEVLMDQLEIYKRNVNDAPRPACCPPPFGAINNWMHDYPKAFLIPLGAGQRSDPEANRLIEWLLLNGAKVEELEDDTRFNGQGYEEGSYVVWMNQARRGLIDTALDIGVDISDRAEILYAPPGAWSHGFLWGAEVVTIGDGARFSPDTDRIRRPNRLDGGIASSRKDDDDDHDDDDDDRRFRQRGSVSGYLLELDSPTAVRAANSLIKSEIAAQLLTGPFTTRTGGVAPAGSVIFATSAARALDDVGEDAGLWFHPIRGVLPASESIDAVPRVGVLPTPGNNFRAQEAVWTLRNLGFTATLLSTAGLNDAAGPDPLANHDVLWTVLDFPTDNPNTPVNEGANATYRARVAAFFARRGGFIGVGTGGASFITGAGQVTGLTAVANSGGGFGYSGIINWSNSGGAGSVVTGAYPALDTAIVDPPTWFTSVPATMTVDGSLPLNPFLAGLAPITWPSSGASVIAHGTNTAGNARLVSFAMNPLYRADPEREWPMLASAAYWADQ